MSKVTAWGTALALGLAALPSGAGAVLGPDAAACRAGSGRPGILVNVAGFKSRSGNLRVQLYGADPAEFLAKGKYVRRVDLPVTASGPMAVCVAAPAPGRYAVAVRHDLDGNGRSGWNDGGGFSRNPRLALPNPKPRHQDVAIEVPAQGRALDVVLNYRQGLSIRPVAG